MKGRRVPPAPAFRLKWKFHYRKLSSQMNKKDSQGWESSSGEGRGVGTLEESKTSGEGGIRTHDTLRYTRFPSERVRPTALPLQLVRAVIIPTNNKIINFPQFDFFPARSIINQRGEL